MTVQKTTDSLELVIGDTDPNVLVSPGYKQNMADLGAANDERIADLLAHEGNETDAHGLDIPNVETVTGAQSKADAAVVIAQTYADAQLRGLAFKAPVRAVSTINVNVTTPGTSFDGVTFTASGVDSVLLVGQTAGADNGIYIWNGASSPLTRRLDADTSLEMKPGLLVVVTDGTLSNRDKPWELKTEGPIVLGTTVLTFGLSSGDTTGLAGLSTNNNFTGNNDFVGTLTKSGVAIATLADLVSSGSTNLRLKIVEGMPYYTYGHSYNTTGGTTAGFFHTRFASRHGTQAVTQRGVGGNLMYQTLANIQSNWTPNSRGLVSIISLTNDIDVYGAIPARATTSAEAFRSCLAYLTSSAVLPYTDTSFAFSASGWTAGATTTVGSYVDFGFSGDSAYVLLGFVTGSSSVATITRSGDGATVATVSTGGYMNAFTGSVKLSGFGVGNHTVRITLASGTALSVVGAAMPADTPPTVVWIGEGAMTGPYTRGGFGTTAEKNASLAADFIPACQAVAATFPTCVQALATSSWDPATCLLADGIHPNDKGHSVYADRIGEALASRPFVQGLNYISRITAGTPYVATTPSYSVTGPPSQVGTVTPITLSGGMQLSWSAPANNGFAISDYVIQYRTTTGPGSWFTFADGTSTATTTTVTGLTDGTSYDFQVAAVNAAGQGAYSVAVSATPGGATIPGAPTGLTAGPNGSGAALLSWTAPVLTGGASIIDYVIQYRTTSGPGSWTTFADGTSTLTIANVTGLVNGTSYDFQVAAVNSVGQGAYGTSASATPNANLVTDTFDRADTTTGLGVTSDGLFTWTTTSRFRILSNQMQGISGTAGAVTIDPAVANVTIQATAAGTTPSGKDTALIFRCVDATHLWGVYCGGNPSVLGKWALWKFNSSNAFPLVTALTATAGDVIKVVLTSTTLELFVNGVSQGVVSDSFQNTATKVGFWQSTGGAFAWNDLTVS